MHTFILFTCRRELDNKEDDCNVPGDHCYCFVVYAMKMIVDDSDAYDEMHTMSKVVVVLMALAYKQAYINIVVK